MSHTDLIRHSSVVCSSSCVTPFLWWCTLNRSQGSRSCFFSQRWLGTSLTIHTHTEISPAFYFAGTRTKRMYLRDKRCTHFGKNNGTEPLFCGAWFLGGNFKGLRLFAEEDWFAACRRPNFGRAIITRRGAKSSIVIYEDRPPKRDLRNGNKIVIPIRSRAVLYGIDGL